MKSFILAALVSIAAAQNHSHPVLEDDIEKMKTDIADLETSIEGAETNCDEQGVQITTISGAVDQLTGWIDPLFDAVLDQSSQIAGIQAVLPDLNDRVAVIED